MRWRERKYPEWGDTRCIKKFLLLPHTIAGETRWLEWVKIEQEYKSHATTAGYEKRWSDVAWGN